MARQGQEPATAKQLWRLNREGRLALVDEGVVIPVSVADAAIRAGLAAGAVPDVVVVDGTSEALEA